MSARRQRRTFTVVFLDRRGVRTKFLEPEGDELAPLLGYALVDPKLLPEHLFAGIQVHGHRRRYWTLCYRSGAVLILSPSGCLVSDNWPSITLLQPLALAKAIESARGLLR